MRLQPLPFLLPLCVVAHEFSKTHGVPPALLARYSPSKTQTWSCLDGSKEISWSAVNDDYCDCSDGSDEPGTGACSNTTFYCQNAGHIGSTIPASRVRDGLCEPECCDGSDEPPGVCADTCLEVGQVYRRKVDAERKLRKTGAKIRSSYIAFARKEKDRLEASIAIAKQEVFAREKEVARLKEIADRSEALSAEALELKKQSPLYGSLLQHANALKSLQREHKKHLEREKTLGDILDALRRGYNPNYQDMAVLEAVRGWEYIAQLPHIGSEDSEGSVDEADTETDEEDLVDDDMWSAQELKDGLDELLQTNYVSLLLEHDTYTNGPVTASLLSDVSAYLPDAIIPQYELLRDTIVSWLRHLGVIESGQVGTPSAGAAKAKDALLNAERDLATAKKELDNAVQDLDELFDPKFFGASGEWRKLSNQCLSKDTGDYTYEVCLFGEAKQKPNGGGQTFSLGHFSGWNDKAPVGSSEYYARQMYTLGTKCWNGPQRSVKLDLACGVENTLVSIQELEKCEYLFTGTTPTLCTSLDALELAGRDEL